MAKNLVTEGVIDKFVDKIFNALKSKKTDQIAKKMRDPELEKRVKKFQEDHDELVNYLTNKYGEIK